MIAAVYHGPGDIRIEERPIPSIGQDEILLQVESASICATDLRISRGSHRKFSPGTVRILGHEIAGTIADTGSAVNAYRAGQRVFVAPNVGCGRCVPCRRRQNNLCAEYQGLGITLDGGFAEYMRIPAPFLHQKNLIPIRVSLDPALAALAEPFACVLRGQRAVKLRETDNVLIMGAGPIGIMHLIAALAHPVAGTIISDRNAERLYLARTLGANRVVDFQQEELATAVAEETHGRGVDVVIVANGTKGATEQALSLATTGGRVNFFAGMAKEDPYISLDANLIHYKELVVTGTTGCSTADCRRSAAMVDSGKVHLSSLITARYPFSRATEALAAAENRGAFKIILEPASADNRRLD